MFRVLRWSLHRPLSQRAVPRLSWHRRLNSTGSTRSSLLLAAGEVLSSDSPLPGGIRLRQYQEECIQSVLKYVGDGHKRLGISLATGAGKTVIFTQLIGRIPPRTEYANQTLIIVHRKELVEQAARHCRLAYPDRTVEIEMGNNKASGAADITIASIQSLISRGRIEKFNPDRFKLVLVDEAHHIVARSYREALEHFGLNEASEESPILVGVSATFSRFDGLKLGAAIDHIVYHKDYVDMIGEQWLADAVFTTVKSEADLSGVRKDKFGDFAIGQLSEAVNTEQTNNITVRAWLSNASDRKSTLVFCVDIEHARQLTATFREHGIDARYITSSTPKDVRSEQLRAFKDQEYPVLLNCGLFTEGTDIPNIDCVLLARPTRSKNLLIQMIGRGLRLHPGKKNCHIIDMVASLRAGVLSTPTLFGLDPDKVLEKANARELSENAALEIGSESQEKGLSDEDDVNVTFTKYDSIFDLLGDVHRERHIRSISPNSWVRVDQARYVLVDRSGWLTIEKDEESNLFAVRHVTKFTHDQTEATVYTRPREVATAPDLDQAVRAADTYASGIFEKSFISSHQRWRSAPATPTQLAMLNKRRVHTEPFRPEDLTRGQAADMITKLKFGLKKRMAAMQTKQRRQQRLAAEKQEFEELKRRGDVKVGPLNAA
ncbi:putative ATP-dependent helicase IRC3 [Paecilomyces lecythidis]